MPSVADELRQETLEEVRHLSPDDRVSRALELGDFDLALFCASQKLEPAVAHERLRQTRQVGRRTSAPQESSR